MTSTLIKIELTQQELEDVYGVLIWLNDPSLNPIAQKLDKSLGDWQRASEQATNHTAGSNQTTEKQS